MGAIAASCRSCWIGVSVNISALSGSARAQAHTGAATGHALQSGRSRQNVGAKGGTNNGRVQATASPPTNVRIEFERHAPSAIKA
jgi:hypothetical protein